MPNYVYNQINFTGPRRDIEDLVDLMTPEFNFHRVIPIPEELFLEAGSRTSPAIMRALSKEAGAYLKILDDPERRKIVYNHVNKNALFDPMSFLIEMENNYIMESDEEQKVLNSLGEKYLTNIRKYNVPHGLAWCLWKWGTKWNSNDAVLEWISDNEICWSFGTANSAPLALINELENRFPGLSYVYTFYERSPFATEYTIRHFTMLD